jgi:hypothetical protein
MRRIVTSSIRTPQALESSRALVFERDDRN